MNPINIPPASAPLTVDEIMRRVRAEVARRQGKPVATQDGTVAADGQSIELPHWMPSAPRLAVKRDYVLAELLSFDDRDFIDQVYRIVLRRPPDAGGFEHFLQKLRSGQCSKVEILGEMRFSPEGMSRGIHIDGLLVPYTLQRWFKKRFIGRPLRWAYAFLRMDQIGHRSQLIQMAQARESQAIGNLYNQLVDQLERNHQATLSSIEQNKAQLQTANNVIADLSQWKHEIESRFTNTTEELAEKTQLIQKELSNNFDKVNTQSAQFSENISNMLRKIEDMESVFLPASRIGEEINRLSTQIDELNGQSESLLNSSNKTDAEIHQLFEKFLAFETTVNARLNPKKPPEENLDPLYAAFEEKFRGSRELVRSRIEPYLEWIREVNAGSLESPVLDIGCGRGEWLELLQEQQLLGRGIDLNHIFIEACRGQGLDVTEGDAIEIMRTLPDNSFGAITSMHLVEHLSYEVMITLIDQARRILKPGGLLLLETPNPENIVVGSYSFYMDPTHKNPIPPESLRWTVEARGFKTARIERLTTGRDIPWPGSVDDQIPGAATINAMSERFVMAPDYAIVAYRP